jgi:hypothetical protein
MTSPLQKEFEYFRAHQDELVAKYNGRFVVIKDDAVIAVFDDQARAVLETQKKHPLGTFLVQRVAPGTSAYTRTFHSRVAVR